MRDLTERQATQRRLQDMQAELIHMSRFTAMGEMASTLAHELNQPLTAVASYLNGCRRLLDGADTLQNLMIRDGIERAADQALRAGQIIRRLRQFVSRRESQRQMENLGKLIEDASALALVGVQQTGCRVTYSSRRRRHVRPGRQGPDPAGDPQSDAQCDRGDAGDGEAPNLTISTVQVDKSTVEVRVADTGPGISPAIATQLFQPFVTTKPQGMGVGLSISRTIIEAHGGQLWADPNPEGGTIFRLTLRTGMTEYGMTEDGGLEDGGLDDGGLEDGTPENR